MELPFGSFFIFSAVGKEFFNNMVNLLKSNINSLKESIMVKDCVFCNLELEANQRMILSNEHCMFLQMEPSDTKGVQLEGAGLIVPKTHRETAFDLTRDEWNATYTLLKEVKHYLDDRYQPQGYNL